MVNGHEVRLEHDEIAAKCGLPEIRALGRLAYDSAQPRLVSHHHENCVEICYLQNGKQFFEVHGAAYWMSGGQVFMTYPGERHSSGEQPMAKGILYYVIIDVSMPCPFMGLEAQWATELKSRLVDSRSHLFDVSPEVGSSLEIVIRELIGKAPCRKLNILRHMQAFLYSVIDGRTHARNRSFPNCENVVAFIRANLHQKLTLEALAGIANLSPSYFKSCFKRCYGMPPREYINHLRIEQAGEQLRSTGKSVTEISYELGFSSSQYFSTIFRQYTGRTPLQYRQEIS